MILKNSCDRTLDQVLEAHGVAWDMFADSLLEASKNGCTAVAKDGVVLYANRMAREGLGILPGSFMTERVPELALRIAGVLSGTVDPGGPLLYRGDAIYMTTVSRVQNGAAILGALCVFIDMTLFESTARRMRAYAELSQQQDAILNALSEGLWICDAKANVLRINPASERLNDIRAEQVVGRNMQELVDEGVFDRSATLEVLARKAPVSIVQAQKGR